MQAGVYRIHCRFNNMYYIGETVNFPRRVRHGHVRELNEGIHKNSPLQRAWQKYGQDSFSIELIWSVPDEVMVQLPTGEISKITKRMEATIAFAMINEGFRLFNVMDFEYWGRASPMTIPIVAAKVASTIRNPLYRAKMSQISLGVRSDPIKNSRMLAACHSDAAQIKRAATMQRQWETGMREKSAAYWSAAGVKEARAAKMRITLSDPSVKAKMTGSSHHASRRILCVQTGQLFDSITCAAMTTSTDRSSIRKALATGAPCKGFHWKIAE